MRKTIAIILAAVTLFSCFVGCGTTPQVEEVGNNLYEMTCTANDYWENDVDIEYTGAMCSGVQNGTIRGRNLDWYLDDNPTIVVHVPRLESSGKTRYASVSVADLSCAKAKDESIALNNTQYMPLYSVDGMNENGVVIQVNVITATGVDVPETTPGYFKGAYVPRLVLDYGETIEQIEDMLSGIAIDPAYGYYELHWMISAYDKNHNYVTEVVEVLSDGIHFIRDFEGDVPVMTNFCISTFDGTAESTGFDAGYERWQILVENADKATDKLQMSQLMKKVYYSNFYSNFEAPYWYSENAGIDLAPYLSDDQIEYLTDTYGTTCYCAQMWGDESLEPLVQAIVADAEDPVADGKTEWITKHTAIYDASDLSLRVITREGSVFDFVEFGIAADEDKTTSDRSSLACGFSLGA